MRSTLKRYLVALFVFAALTSSALGQTAFDISRMDRNADACEDFFQFANGTWVKNTEIPASQARWGTFNILGDRNRDILHSILEDAAKKKAPKGSDVQLIGDYYAACMDEDAIEANGIKPIEPILASIDAMKTQSDVVREIAELHNQGFPALFRLGGGRDMKDSNSVIVNSGQGGLSLPNKDYYTKTDAKMVETRAKFVEYMTKVFDMSGDTPAEAKANADAVMAIQMRLANASKAPVEMRDPDKNYNKIKLADAQAVIPNLPLKEYMKRRGIPVPETLNFGQPDFFKEVNAMLKEVPVSQWKTYFRWMVLDSSASYLPKALADASFDFHGRYLSGTKEQEPRWKRCVSATDRTLGEALGAEYVKTEFTPEAKARMNQLIDNLFVAMKDHINALDWMSATTKEKALAKLGTYKRKIGYNEHPRGYKGLSIDRSSYAGNVLRARVFEGKRNIADIGKPADKTRWFFSPPTVNASYSGTNNEITFPAGILQPPFFNFKADDAINYGAIGAVIGHEITHGFDDSGSKFDKDGNLASWWTPEDRKKFDERAACVVDQFNGYEVQPGLHINGKLTLGENIGDLGGLAIAYSALVDALKGKKIENIDGFTPEQRFFLGWAQVWAAKATPEFERRQVLTDPHSAASFRVNGPLSNMPEFAKAFGCKQGQAMVRKNVCLIW
ncbi:MAG: endothelin-converting protein 1 [Acidobacteria bacterium OLB17]|nr:MAG: endothelin-converting protein 1 [Acidobacteria bacterium OLB17]MCZ2390767.1 M13 family metallopeptidase [Acidobacteriota bacterium]